MSDMKQEPERSTEDVRRHEPRDEVRHDDVRSDDDRRAEPDQMRPNPEVQGRTEPQEMPGRHGGPGGGQMERPMASQELDAWPDMRKYKERMADVHSMFIDDPRKAVQEAERLIDEMVDYMARSMHEQVQRWHKDVEGNADTEKLRLMMREFSHMMDQFERRRAA